MQTATRIHAEHYSLRTLEEIFALSEALARYFPSPDQVMTGIYELLLNAVEHGNLGIGSAAKDRLVRAGKWEAEIMRRLSLPHYAGKKVEISIERDESECRLTIADQGKGFRWQDYLRQGANPKSPHGRGLLIAFSAGFDRIDFNARGNAVTCVMVQRAV